MTTSPKESDWKILRRVHPLAVERFCERVLDEVERFTHQSNQSYHERYLRIFKLMQQRDREIARLFDDPMRSRALAMIARIRSEGLMTDAEFSSLSEEAREAVEMLLGAG